MIKPLLFLLSAAQALAQNPDATPPEGMHWQASQRSFNQTWTRLQQAAGQRGMQVISAVRHESHARGQLRPTATLSLSNRRLGTRLLQCAQSLALALPIRVAVWQSSTGRVFLAYPDIPTLLEQHRAQPCAGPAGKALSRHLEEVVKFASH